MRSTCKHRSQWLRGTLVRSQEILGSVACVPAILLRGLEGLRSPRIVLPAPTLLRTPCPYTTFLALALNLALALVLGHRLSLALPFLLRHHSSDGYFGKRAKKQIQALVTP